MDNAIFWYKTTILLSLSSWLEGRGWEVHNMLLRDQWTGVYMITASVMKGLKEINVFLTGLSISNTNERTDKAWFFKWKIIDI